MRKTKSRKLSLNKSTVRQLDAEGMSRAAGGSALCTKLCPPASAVCVSAACSGFVCGSALCAPASGLYCPSAGGVLSGCGQTE